MRRGIAGFGVLLVGSVQLAGIAGAATKAPSHDAYVEKADAICERTTNRIDAIVEDLGFSPTDKEARAAVDRVVALTRTQITKLRALAPPTGEAKRVRKVYDAVDRALDRIDQRPGSLVDEPGPFAKATKLAESYGFEECGRG